MSEGKEEQRVTLLAPMSGKQLLGTGLVGVMIGLIVWAVGSAVDQYVLQLLFCQNGDMMCYESTSSYAVAVGTILGAGLGLFSLIKLRILRPLLVVVAAMAALWNLSLMVGELPLYGVILANALLYAGMYMLLAWLARLRSMYVVLLLFIVIIVAMRFALTS